MKNVIRRFSNLSIRTVLTILLFPFFLVLMICCIYFYISGVTHYSDLVKENAESLVKQSRDSLNQDIINIQDGADSVLEETVFYTMESNIEAGKDPIEPEDYLTLYNSFTNFQQHYSVYIDSIGLYLSDNSIYYYRSNTGTDLGVLRDVEYEKYFDRGEKLIWVSASEIVPARLAENLPYQLAMIRPLGNEKSRLSGVLLMGVRDEAIFTGIENSRPTPNSISVLLRQNGEIFSGRNQGEEEGDPVLEQLDQEEIEIICRKTENAEQDQILSFEIGEYFVVYTPILLQDTGILSVVPKGELYMSYRNFTHIFVVFAVIVILIFLILYFVIPRYFSEPVTRLLRQMQKINEPAARKITVGGYREIIQIGDGINDMMERIRVLTESIHREMEAKQATQLQYLFAQINPHFLYNTLDCIRELCTCGENEKAEEMIGQLAVFYRIGVSKGRSFITLEQEIRHATAYLSILQTRFEDFQYKVEFPDELKNCVTLRMILQPVVENAVCHGLRPYRTDGTVSIKVMKKGNIVEIHVKDNGAGIAEDVLLKVKKSLDEPICEYTKESYGVYGLKNVQDRIQIAYGQKYKIQIETETDCGTEVILSIPYEEEHR